MLPLSAWIQVAGGVQLAIGLANLPLASRLQYRKNLAGASAIVREVFYVHAAYIVLVVLGCAALSLQFPTDLAGGGRAPRTAAGAQTAMLGAMNGGGLLFSRGEIAEPAAMVIENLGLVP